MSWGFKATAKDKAKLKEHCRKQCLAYHQERSRGHCLMSKVADIIDAQIDLFQVGPDKMIWLETCGHLECGSAGPITDCIGNFKCEISSYGGTLVE